MLQINLLGPFDVTVDGQRVTLEARAQRKLLAIFALEAGAVLSVDRISEAFWGEDQPGNPTAAIRFHIHKLRNILGDAGDLLATRSKAYVLDIPASAIDVNQFYSLVNAGKEALTAGDPTGAAGSIDSALRLWRDTPLGEFAYDDFAQPELRRLEEARALALQSRYEAGLQLGKADEAVRDLAGLVEEYPYREGLWALYITALHRTGRSVDAMRQAQRFRERLAEDTGLEPSGLFVEAESAVLLNDPTPTVPATTPTSSMPSPIGALIGRDVELGEITTRLGGARLLTLTGPPGAGKTRIALAAVASLEADRPGHAWFVDASHIESRTDLESAIGLAMGLGDAATTTEIASVASARPGVLLLDDAPSDAEQVAELVARLLAAAPALTMLATSTDPLGVAGESTYRLRPLATEASVELFTNIRGGVPLDTAEIEALCEAVGNLPLGVELQAANYMPGVSDLADTGAAGPLDDAIRAAIKRRPEEQQAALGRIAMLDGWFAASEAMTIGRCSQADFRALSAGSLVAGPDTHGRYSVLDPIRRIAADVLDPADADEVRSTLLDLGLAEMRAQRNDAASDPHRMTPLVRWATDRADRRGVDAAAMLARRLWRNGSTISARRMLAATLTGADWEPSPSVEEATFFAAVCALADGDLGGAQRFADRHAQIAAALGNPRAKAFSLQLDGSILLEQGRLADAVTAQRKAVDIWRQLDDIELATSLGSLGYLLARWGASDEAAAVCDEIDTVAARQGVDLAAAQREGIQAWMAVWNGSVDDARRHYTNQRQQFAALDHAQGLGVALQHSAWLEIAAGDHDAALGFARQALRLGQDIGRMGTEPALYSMIAIASVSTGDVPAAQVALARALPDGRQPTPPEDAIWTLRAAAVIESMRGGSIERVAGAAEAIRVSVDLAYPEVLETWWTAATGDATLATDTTLDVGLFLAKKISRNPESSD